jgi:hypothetical protein
MLDLGFDPGMARVKPEWVVGETALHVAVAHGRQPVAALLIERGAPLEAKRRDGWTPLRVAFLCLEQQSEWTPNEYTLLIAEALIKAGACVEDAGLTLTASVCLGRSDDTTRMAGDASAEEKQKALAAAAYNGRLDAIDAAIVLGADPNAPNVGLNPNATALHNAVCSGSLAAVQKLVEAGASVDGKDGPYKATPLQWAEYFVRESAADKVEYFQREGPKPKQYVEIAAYLGGRRAPLDINGGTVQRLGRRKRGNMISATKWSGPAKSTGLAVVIALSIALPAKLDAAEAESFPADSPRWQFGPEAKITNYLGRDCLALEDEKATLRDFEFADGVIDVDMAGTEARGFYNISFIRRCSWAQDHGRSITALVSQLPLTFLERLGFMCGLR